MARRDKMTERNILTLRTGFMLLLIIGLGTFAAIKFADRQTGPDPRNDFAQCLTDKGAVMYGAYWCPHCTAQKKKFGKAFSRVSYVECAVPGNPRDQTQKCKEANITGYPTWTFADGSRTSGEQSFQDLADKTGCVWSGN